ncbi:major facilitator superfamily domain-containing protein [Phaeosphaeriaceae sp. PMI808]|nr:major facilitator superfamily domain-containing protein [Phaeosphaeriaceae sp. PMI808]
MPGPERSSKTSPPVTSSHECIARHDESLNDEHLGSESSKERSRKGEIAGDHNIQSKDDTISIAPSGTSTSSDHSPCDHEARSAASKSRPGILSRTTSVTIDAIIVPRAQRRGLLAQFALIPEVENPVHYTRKTKWVLTSIVAFCAMAAPMGSAIVMPVLQEIAIAFNASPSITNLSVAVYMLSMAIFPLWWSSFSERLGRRTIYIISFMLFVVFAILSAISQSIAMLIVMRVFSGGAAASVQAVGAGTIADVWEVRERGKAMGVFYLGPLCGPLFAPIIGGALGSGLGWRSTQWFLVIYGSATLIFIIFALPETLHRKHTISSSSSSSSKPTDTDPEKAATEPELLRTTTRASTIQKTKSFLIHTRQIFIDPLKILLWLRYPPVALTVYYASITFGCLYILNISIQSTFSSTPYSYSTLVIGFLYIPNSAGYLLASVFGGRWIDTIMAREARKANRYDESGKLIFRPEDRMRENAWIAAVLWPAALLLYGWTAEYHIHISVPMIANFFFGVGSMLIFALVNTMLTEFMPKRAASGIALNNFARNICSSTGAVIAEPVLSAIGNGWFMTIIGVWSLVTGCAALGVMRIWGGKWRKKMVEELG